MTRALKIAIIGAGRIGVVHGRSVATHPMAELSLVADPNLKAAQAIASAYGPGTAAATAQVQDVFDAEVDAVIVGSPTAFHVPQIISGLRSGKAVLVEKPVDLDLARVDECITAAGADANRVMVGFNRRFDPAMAQVHARVQSGEIGELQQLTIISRDPAPPPAAYLAGSGGIFRDMTIHDFDMARYFLGPIATVSAIGRSTRPESREAGDYDQAVTTLVAESGAVATIINSRHCAAGYDQRLEAFGPDGSLEVGNVTATSVRVNTAAGTGIAEKFQDFFLDRYAQAYTAELDRFVRCVLDADAPSPDLIDGREALVLADAATQSANTGAPVVLADMTLTPGA